MCVWGVWGGAGGGVGGGGGVGEGGGGGDAQTGHLPETPAHRLAGAGQLRIGQPWVHG